MFVFSCWSFMLIGNIVFIAVEVVCEGNVNDNVCIWYRVQIIMNFVINLTQQLLIII